MFEPSDDSAAVHVATLSPETDRKTPKGPTRPNRRRAPDSVNRRIKRRARCAKLPLRVWARKHANEPEVRAWMARKGVK